MLTDRHAKIIYIDVFDLTIVFANFLAQHFSITLDMELDTASRFSILLFTQQPNTTAHLTWSILYTPKMAPVLDTVLGLL